MPTDDPATLAHDYARSMQPPFGALITKELEHAFRAGYAAGQQAERENAERQIEELEAMHQEDLESARRR